MSEWREFYYGPHGRRYRWKVGGWRDDGTPHGLELERWHGSVEEWAPVPNASTSDAFLMGLAEGRKVASGAQTRLEI